MTKVHELKIQCEPLYNYILATHGDMFLANGYYGLKRLYLPQDLAGRSNVHCTSFNGEMQAYWFDDNGTLIVIMTTRDIVMSVPKILENADDINRWILVSLVNNTVNRFQYIEMTTSQFNTVMRNEFDVLFANYRKTPRDIFQTPTDETYRLISRICEYLDVPDRCANLYGLSLLLKENDNELS